MLGVVTESLNEEALSGKYLPEHSDLEAPTRKFFNWKASTQKLQTRTKLFTL